MIVNIIATGSTGNLYELLDSAGNSILIEAGVPRDFFVKNREGKKLPEMCVVSHRHGDHAKYSNEYRMVCPVYLWQEKAESDNFKALGFELEHGGVLNYAYLIKLLADDQFVFFATDMEYSEEKFERVFYYLRKYEVTRYLIECNYNDYLYHQANKEERVGNDRHFSDNDVVRFFRTLGRVGDGRLKIVTIHGSNGLSGDTYTRRYLSGKLPASKVGVAIGAKGGVKDLKYL